MTDDIKTTVAWTIPAGSMAERRQFLTEYLTPEEITQILGIMVNASLRVANSPTQRMDDPAIVFNKNTEQ